MVSCLFTISYPNLTDSLRSHNSYSASVTLNVRSMYGSQKVCECPEIVCKIIFMYVLSGEACQIWGGVQDSKVRQILYKPWYNAVGGGGFLYAQVNKHTEKNSRT